MKKTASIVLLFTLSPILAFSQEMVSVSAFLKRKGADKTAYSVRGVYTETVNQEDLVFLLRDNSGELMFKLSDEGPEAAMAFRSEKVVPGDTLTITGVRKRI